MKIVLPDTLVAVSFAPLIRLVAEIDDHGPIRPGRLSATLPDLATHHLRQATRRARTLGLVCERPGEGLTLTEAGRDLADLYDQAARWARASHVPTQHASFAARVRFALRRTASVSAQDRGDPGLARVSELVELWLASWGEESDEPPLAA
ncbi:hypothetical protein ACFY1V_12955 [Streptomyces sp. NPDC001255]|uniref:hypothetical protein n=1 Tax=Streptomyces sp. NPDC001255 TaxID=3364550 RepID=UPI0036CBE68E